MKLVKMSLAAAVLLGASAFALDNVKVDGDAKVYYFTKNADTTNAVTGAKSNSLFSKGTSAADAALRIGVTGNLMKNVSFGATGYAISTLGLENNLVDATWTGAHTVRPGTGAGYPEVDDKAWMGEMWVAATLSQTTLKLGRMELDTPLAFSEKWSVVPNTFDAIVAVSQEIADTTIVAGWVGKGNGTNAAGMAGLGGKNQSVLDSVGLALDAGVVGADASFTTFAKNGAYTVGFLNNSFKPLTFQGWSYNVSNIASAYWLQGDVDCQLVKGLKLGAQYAAINTKITGTKDSGAYAARVAYEAIPKLKVGASYSKADTDGTLKVANVATNNLGTAQSKLYTEAYWNYGYVGAAGAESFAVAADYDAGVAQLFAQYTDINNKSATVLAGADHDVTELVLSASKSFGPLDATLAYISTDAKDQNVKVGNTTGSRYDSVLAMLKVNF
ncbi:MAG: OprD family outer membrane porin [Sulfuricurvum sp.]|jgi:hypothetical protein|uniref:OprD family outer membrane porin n=1 Tax=Sulfuricurvum sp. TaxID=2025608 RepID=UPI0026011D5D|nr:OprD family outer membrane porin [Sulfuricurvum sp.]MCK9371738.1 OprD family outer membrane porin [Sulfuricurvum sp.]